MEQSLVAKFTLKLQEALQDSRQAKEQLKTDFQEVQSAAKVKPEIDSSAIGAVKSKIEELKSTLTNLKSQQGSLVDIGAIKASESAIQGVESEIKNLSGTLGRLQGEFSHTGAEAEKGFHHVVEKAEPVLEKFKEIKTAALGVFGGAALTGGAFGFGKMVEGIVDGAKDAVREMDKLTLAYNGNKQLAKETMEKNDALGESLAVLPSHLNEISANAAIMGGALGEKLSPQLTMLAGGIEKMNIQGMDAQSVLRGFLKGGEEGADGIGRLTQAFPELGGKLDGITDPAEKVNKALEILGPKFKILGDQAHDPANASVQLQIQMEKLYKSLGTLVLPVVEKLTGGLMFFAGILSGVVNLLSNAPESLHTVIDVLGALVGVVGAAVLVHRLYNSEMIKNLINSGKAVIAWGAKKIAMIADTVQTGFATIAQDGLNLSMLAFPGMWIVAIAALVVAGFVWLANEVGGVGNAFKMLWGVIKGVGNFISEFVQSYIGNLVKAFQGVGKVIHGLLTLNFSEALDGAKQVGSSIVKAYTEPIKKGAEGFKSSMDETKKSIKDADAAAAKAGASGKKAGEDAAKGGTVAAESWKNTSKAYDDYTAGIKQGVDDETKYVNAMRLRLAMGGQMVNGVLVKDPENARAQIKKNIDLAIQYGKQYEALNRQVEAIGQKTNEDILGKDGGKTSKEKAQKKAFQQMIQDQVNFQKDQLDLNEQSRSTTIANLNALLAQAKLAHITLNEEDRKALIEQNAFRKKAGEKALTEQEYIDHLRMKGLDLVRKEIETQTKQETTSRRTANSENRLELEQQIDDLKEKLTEKLKIITDAAKKGDITEQQAAQDRIEAQRHADQAILIATVDFNAKKRKEGEADRKTRLDEEKKNLDDRFYLEERAAKNIRNIYEQQLALNDIATRRQQADLELQVRQEKDASKAKLDAWSDEQQKRIALMADGPDKAKAEHAFELDLAQRTSDEAAMIQIHAEDTKTQIARDGARARLQIQKDHLEKENVLFQAGAKAFQDTFGHATQGIQSALGQMFGYEKKQMQQMTANDKALTKADMNDQLAKLATEMQQGKISYQRYMLEKEKANEDYQKKLQGNQQDQLSFTQQIEKSITDTILSELSKQAEAQFAQWAEQEILAKGKATTGLIAGIFSSVPFPLDLVLAAGAFGVISALFAQISKPKGAAQGEYITGPGGPTEDNHMRRVSAGETIVDAYTTSRLGGSSFLSNAKLAAMNINRSDHAMHMSGNIIPRVSPTLSSGFRSSSSFQDKALLDTLKQLHAVASDLHKNGIDITGKIDAKLNPKESERANRKRRQAVQTRAYTTGGGMNHG